MAIQATHRTEAVLRDMSAVGRECVVSFPNFGYWRNRLQLALGRMPVNSDFPYHWYDTPNIHLCTLADFEAFCAARGIQVRERIVLHDGHRVAWAPNLRGSLAVYRFSRSDR